MIHSCLRDLNHPFDQRLETGRLPEDATQAGTVSASTATRCRDVGRRLAGLDFDIFRQVRWRQLALAWRDDLNGPQHNALQ
jgi:hypothetical protein